MVWWPSRRIYFSHAGQCREGECSACARYGRCTALEADRRIWIVSTYLTRLGPACADRSIWCCLSQRHHFWHLRVSADGGTLDSITATDTEVAHAAIAVELIQRVTVSFARHVHHHSDASSRKAIQSQPQTSCTYCHNIHTNKTRLQSRLDQRIL
jgi:hypothetical protein